MRSLCYALFYLGDRKKGATLVDDRPPEEQISALAPEVRRLMNSKHGEVTTFLLNCAVQLGHKVSSYAMLIGLLNADDPTSISALVSSAAEGVGTSLRNGDSGRARLLLRLLAALVVPGVLHPTTMLTALGQIVSSALAIATDAGPSSDGRSWQPYTDSVVHAALMALPWGGSDLVGAADDESEGRQELEDLWKTVESYMAVRPRSQQPGLAPFFPSAGVPEDDTSQSDSGGASFLGELWDAFKEWRTDKYTAMASLPTLDLQASEAVLATGEPCLLPAMTVPRDHVQTSPNASAAEIAAMTAAFPPRGGIRLLNLEHTRGTRSALERLIGQEYILDSMLYFDGDRVESAVRLASGLPLPYKHEPLLAEVLFSQLLKVPKPRHKPLAYATLMVDLCKLLPAFPRSMSTCVRECFSRMKALDPQLRLRLAEWQAYHMSNYDFMWPWAKWSQVLTAGAADPQRRYVITLMSRLIRLSYYDRVHSVIPDDFKPLLPPQPAVQALPAAQATTAATEAAVPSGDSIESIETTAASQILVKIKAKDDHDSLKHWMEDGELVDALGGPAGAVACVARAILVAGGKSFTHTVIALERYIPLLQHFLEAAGPEGEQAIVGVAARVWEDSPLRGAMAIDRLMALRLASASSIVAWSFAALQSKRLDDELAAGLAWDSLYAAVNKTIARTQDAADDVKDAREHFRRSDPTMSEEELEVALADPRAAQVEAAKEQKALLLQTLRSFKDLIVTATDEAATAEAAALSSALAPSDMQVDTSTAKQTSEGEGTDATEVASTVPPPSKDEKASAMAAVSWRAFVVANLRSFVRCYSLQLASFAEQIEKELFPDHLVAEDVHAAVLLSLYL